MLKQKNQRCLAILLVVLVSNPVLSAGVVTSPINQTQVIDFLNETINWYQQIAFGQPESPSPMTFSLLPATLPSRTRSSNFRDALIEEAVSQRFES